MYAQFYNLVAEPFQLTPDHRFFFPSSVHNQALAHLTYGLNQGEGFIVITGDIGAGKTTLVAHLLSTLDSRKYVAAKVVTTQLGADDLLRSVVAAFGVKADPNSKSDMLRQLEAFLAFSHRSGKRCLLLIDEAQNLTPTALEELRMLSNFQVGERAPLQSFILGQPQFRAVLNTPELEQLRQRIIANYHLGPLDVAETQSYIEHRLQTAGWQNDPSLAPDVFAAIHRFTEGVPRRINNLANRLFLYGFLEEKHHFDGSDVERVARDLTREENPDIRGKDLVGLPRDNRVTIVNDPGQVDELRQRLDQIEQRQPAGIDTRPVEDLRRRLDLIEEYVRLRAMADRAFEDLVRRVTAMEDAAKGAAAPAADIAGRIAALEAALNDRPSAIDPARIETIEQQLVRLGEQIQSAPSAESDELNAFAARLSTLEAVARQPAAAAGSERLDAIEARLAALAGDLADRVGKLDAQGHQGRAELATRFDAIEKQVAGIAAAASAGGANAAQDATAAVRAEIRALADRIKAVEQRKPSGDSEGWAARCDAIEKQLARMAATAGAGDAKAAQAAAAAAEGEIHALAERIKTVEQRKPAGDGDGLAALDARLRKLEKKPAAPPATEGLDTLLRRIAAIEAAQSAAGALTKTVGELTARLESVDAMVRTLPRNGAAADMAPRLAAIEDAISSQQAMLKRAIGLAAGLLERNHSRELRDAS